MVQAINEAAIVGSSPSMKRAPSFGWTHSKAGMVAAPLSLSSTGSTRVASPVTASFGCLQGRRTEGKFGQLLDLVQNQTAGYDFIAHETEWVGVVPETVAINRADFPFFVQHEGRREEAQVEHGPRGANTGGRFQVSFPPLDRMLQGLRPRNTGIFVGNQTSHTGRWLAVDQTCCEYHHSILRRVWMSRAWHVEAWGCVLADNRVSQSGSRGRLHDDDTTRAI
eukprot:scaffold2476_cov193-Amphora_coffeaeformis.AAC.6